MIRGDREVRATLWAVMQRDLQAIAKMNAQLERLAEGLERQ